MLPHHETVHGLQRDIEGIFARLLAVAAVIILLLVRNRLFRVHGIDRTAPGLCLIDTGADDDRRPAHQLIRALLRDRPLHAVIVARNDGHIGIVRLHAVIVLLALPRGRRDRTDGPCGLRLDDIILDDALRLLHIEPFFLRLVLLFFQIELRGLKLNRELRLGRALCAFDLLFQIFNLIPHGGDVVLFALVIELELLVCKRQAVHVIGKQRRAGANLVADLDKALVELFVLVELDLDDLLGFHNAGVASAQHDARALPGEVRNALHIDDLLRAAPACQREHKTRDGQRHGDACEYQNLLAFLFQFFHSSSSSGAAFPPFRSSICRSRPRLSDASVFVSI